MSIIKNLELHNFESFHKALIDLHPGFNVIVGRSNSGKSAIVNAISWVLFNNLSGTGFIPDADKPSGVSLEILDSKNEAISLSRIRSQAENSYYMNGAKFASVGSDAVPQAIKERLSIDLLNVDNELFVNLNVGYQKEPLFLISFSGPQRSKLCGRVSNLHIIDKVSKNLNYQLKEIYSKRRSIEDSTKEIEEEKKKFIHLDEVKSTLDNVEDELSKLEEINIKTEALISTYNDLKSVKTRYQALKDNFTKMSEIEGLIQKDFDDLVKLQEKRLLFNKALDIRSRYSILKSNLEKLNALETPLQTEVKSLEETIPKLENMRGLQGRLVSNESTRNSLYSTIVDTDEKLKISIKEATEFLEKIGKCPVCGAELKDHDKIHLFF